MRVTPYPLRTEPVFRDYLWGGRNLHTKLGKPLPSDGVWAESWEIIDHPEHSSVVANGALAGRTLGEVSQQHRAWLFGAASEVERLPLLFKFLDCQRVLSVQVHPEDNYAKAMQPPDLGKTEAWYIIEAEPGAVLYAGLKKGTTHADLVVALENGQVELCLHEIQPTAGDCIFIPAGTVHALGAGLLVAEIQQASNTTFRLFDWNRLDANGKPRALHIEQSLQVIDFESGPRELQKSEKTEQAGRERLVNCDKFVLDRFQSTDNESFTGDSPMWLAGDGRLHLIALPRGSATLGWSDGQEVLRAGDSLVLPASMPQLELQLDSNSVLLDMY